ncbi:MAG: hypothetical protein D3924_04675 [Candidatus Electrothrix sp. AR4]|nr:hypothetical protein [Candidatus Electrothrix sp. AR4]
MFVLRKRGGIEYFYLENFQFIILIPPETKGHGSKNGVRSDVVIIPVFKTVNFASSSIKYYITVPVYACTFFGDPNRFTLIPKKLSQVFK